MRVEEARRTHNLARVCVVEMGRKTGKEPFIGAKTMATRRSLKPANQIGPPLPTKPTENKARFKSSRNGRTDATRGHQTSSNTIKHHQTPSDIIKHHQTSSNTIRHHQTSSDIIKHHQTSSNTIKHHQTPSNIIKHHQIGRAHV